ncbi:MAG: DNA topoisomerase IV subunit A [Alphaproteobacteria bacterium]|nr:DNA topoisomerase IV subunit A [Alphaproteobacteria bacterium]MBP7758879.1 DNA topoisomerase IV subunit A [Alphaproteobacteria bacterium]MBP7762153.1 DNA topoisomerase IV subunit A [Alphaproteobacteria bacterium]MBP7905923.1 DNA topoisomerase IV subunit A [Alphaproteobacteria bacterium]
MAKNKNTAPAAEIIDQPFGDILSERYLSYALSTIVSRSLPDVRDGLKPVHRRILYAMHLLRLRPDQKHVKSARVVGDVMGKFHPHGDTAIYDTMVRVAQDFAQRYPLVDGQGNFGNIDGDNAAAMRYTEARLTEVALLLLEGIEENAVDFRPTYDNQDVEPVVLPAAFPNLLANGSSGIAVGMATNIPPHNVAELCEAMELMLESDPSVADLVKIVKGPDFPTGGILVEGRAEIIKAYETGRGAFRIRAKWCKEELKGGSYQIVVTEIPYQVEKSKMVERIADLIHTKKIPMLDDVRDESAEDIRLVLVPKNRSVEPELLMEALFRACDLETRFNLNLNVLENGKVPKVMNLKEVLQNWLDHQQDVLVRRSQFQLDKLLRDIEKLQGFMLIYLNVDKVIKIIRFDDHPKDKLIKTFKLTEFQAEEILNMRLRALNKLQEIEIKQQLEEKEQERDRLEKLIKSEARQWSHIKKQIGDLKKRFGQDTALGKRRTKIGKPPAPITVDLNEAMIEKEPVTVICSDKGWIRGMKGHGHDLKDLKYKDGDRSRFTIEAQTTDKIVVFATNGRFYTLGCDKLPSARGFGEPVRLMVDIPNDAEITGILVFRPGQKILVASTEGRGFIVPSDDVLAQTKSGKQILNVSGTSEASVCRYMEEGDDHIAVIGKNRKMLVFEIGELPVMSRGKGVRLQKFKDGGLSDAKTFNWVKGLTFKYGAGETLVGDLNPWVGPRASAGRVPPNGFPKTNRFD